MIDAGAAIEPPVLSVETPMDLNFIPRSGLSLDVYVDNVLVPRRQDQRWLAAYGDAYARAETVWPTEFGHRDRDIYAMCCADLVMAEALKSDAAPSVEATPPKKPATPEAKKGRKRPKAARETVAEIHLRRAIETKEMMARFRAMPATGAPLPLGPIGEPISAAAPDEIGFAATVNPVERKADGWSRAFQRADKEGL